MKQSPPPGADGKYGRNTEVTLSVGTMPSDWAFEGWSGAVSARTPSITVVMDSDKVVTATFTPLQRPWATPQPVARTPTPAGPPGTVLIEDPTGDWAYPSGALTSAWGNLTSRDPNSPRPAPLPVPFIDFKSVAIRVDGDNLVVRYQVAAPLPRTKDDFPVIDGQRIAGFSIWMPIDTVNNPNAGESFAEAWLFNGWSVRPDGRLGEEVSYLLDPSPGLPIQPYGYYTAKKARLLSGGPGYDYLEVAYPLSDLGVRPDQTIILGVFARAIDQQNGTVSGDFFQQGVLPRPDGRHGLRLGTELMPPPPDLPAQAIPPVISDLPSCGDRQELFTTSPILLSDLRRIFPRGGLAPRAGHLFPMPFLGLLPHTTVGADGLYTPVEVPVVAPVDMKILVVSWGSYYYKGRLLWELYGVSFAPCREVVGNFRGMTSLSPGLIERLQPPHAFASPGDDPEKYDYSGWVFDKAVEGVYLRAGDLMGTFGGNPNFIAMEFQLQDYSAVPLSYANPSRWAIGYRHNVCPIDYFVPEVRDALRAKLGAPEGPRTAEPRCGEIAVDKPGTAQGYWFVPGSYWGDKGFVAEGQENAEKIVTLDPYFGDPSLLVFNVGTSMQKSGLPTESYVFVAKHSGAVNRDFKEVMADGQVYCYEQFFRIVGIHEGNAQRIKVPSTIILLQLTSPTTLRVERQAAEACGSGPWQFGTAYTDFER